MDRGARKEGRRCEGEGRNGIAIRYQNLHDVLYSQGLSKTSIAETSLSSASLGICMMARTLSVLWFIKDVGPWKSGSKVAASTASKMFQVEVDDDDKPSTIGDGLR